VLTDRDVSIADRVASHLHVAFGHTELDLDSESERDCERGKSKADSCDKLAQSQRCLGKRRARRKPRRLCIIARLRG